MKPVKVNVRATILEGFCKRQSGVVVAFDSLENEVWVWIDCFTTVITSSENIKQ